ncbi:hypothetical protein FBZ89_13633 [Nitrospirillum amazonense]|uniref:HTH marR-type domain-containing protein n=2 Tax=Nitrospirillum amazonense TaxID=28077 RepID=A0A560EL46_9PROT|nr:hypothetical protein FBZ89_13633 [Nitrospirillum amazonense]
MHERRGICRVLPSNAALLIIDLQKAIDDHPWAVHGPRNNPEAETVVARLLAAWREAGRPISNADLARLAMLTPQTVSVIVANLERAATIRRLPHGVHGRILQIELTPSGLSLLRRCRERVQALEREVSQSLSEVEEAVVKRWLAGVAKGEP